MIYNIIGEGSWWNSSGTLSRDVQLGMQFDAHLAFSRLSVSYMSGPEANLFFVVAVVLLHRKTSCQRNGLS